MHSGDHESQGYNLNAVSSHKGLLDAKPCMVGFQNSS